MILTGGTFRSLVNGVLSQGTYRVAGSLVIDGLDASAPLDNGVSLTYQGANSRIVGNNGNVLSIKNNLASGSLTLISTAKTFATTSTNSFTNSGSLTVGQDAAATFTGNYFTNFANSTLSNGAGDTTGTTTKFDVSGTLKFDNANIVTNATDLTLRAIFRSLDSQHPSVLTAVTGAIVNQGGQNALQNFAVNTGRFALRDSASFTVGNGVGTFTQRGTLVVDQGSTFDFNHATVNNVAADTPDYFVAGTLKSLATFGSTDGTHFTFFGPDAQWLVNGANALPTLIGTGGTLTFAGGYTGLYTGAYTITNNGLWELGSATSPNADGGTLRSGGYAMLGTGTDTVTINGPGTVRVYGGATDDDTQLSGTFVNNLPRGLFIDHATMNGGTLDLNGPLMFGTGGVLTLNGVLTSTVGGGSLVSTNSNRGTLNLVGGLILANNINTGGAGFNFTYVNGSPLSLNNVQLTLNNLNLGTTFGGALSLANNSGIRNTAGASVLNFTTNGGSVTLVNNPATMSFTSNTGTIALDELHADRHLFRRPEKQRHPDRQRLGVGRARPRQRRPGQLRHDVRRKPHDQ